MGAWAMENHSYLGNLLGRGVRFMPADLPLQTIFDACQTRQIIDGRIQVP
jgi:hypothetical protein